MIKILTESGFKVGLGHLTRMRSLKDQLIADGYPSRLIVQTDSSPTNGRQNLASNEKTAIWINNIESFKTEVNKSDIVVMDTYNTTASFMWIAAANCARLIAIDDYNRIPYRGCAVINPNYYGSFIDYPPAINAEYYLGSSYTLVRPEFHPLANRTVSEKVREILITFGGTDVMGLTAATIRHCHNITPDAVLDVVVTSSFSDVESIAKELRNNDNLYKDIDAETMNRLMNQADFAIASAGSTSNELFRTQCPSVLTKVAENQSMTMEYLEPLGYFRAFEGNRLDGIDEMLDPAVRKGIFTKLASLESSSSAKTLIEHIYDDFVRKTK